MKRVLKLAVAVVALVATIGCSEPDFGGTQFLDVTPNNIKGTWCLKSFDNGVQLAEGSYRYIVFDRADRTFVSYDNLSSMGQVTRTGRYAIITDGAAVIRGMYDYGQGDWEHRYYVRNLTNDSMVWVATDDESIALVYERAELPSWITPKVEE